MSEPNESCLMCERVAGSLQSGRNPYLIWEFRHSTFVVGDHQFYRGYSQLVLKDHARELHELDPTIQAELFLELMAAGQAIVKTFQPWKMNYSCYGNVVQHIHWHLFPRYESDPDHKQVPWVNAKEFEKHSIDAPTAQDLAVQIRVNLT